MKKTYFLISLLIVLSCCKDDPTPCFDIQNPECENYDPCFDKDSVRASFVIEQFTGPGNPNNLQYIIEDSIFGTNTIRFRSTIEGAEYTWYLGAEVINAQQFERKFNAVAPGTTIGVSLVAQKQPTNLSCFPNDDGRDSVYRTFKVVERCDYLIDNQFKGVFESSPNDSVTVEFTRRNFETGICGGNFFAVNIDSALRTSDTLQFSGFRSSYSKLYLLGSGFGNPSGEVIVDPATKEVSMEYLYQDINRKFHGKILNP